MSIRHHISKLLYCVLLALLPLAANANTKFTYFVNDAVGSPVVAMNQTGAVVWRKAYQPYGKASGKDRDNRIGYTGHVEDQPDLVYAGARYYDPALGRFLSDDPVRFTEKNPMSFNRYAYANNNPYRFVDPDGRTAYDIEVARKLAIETQGNDLNFPDRYVMVNFATANIPGTDKNTVGYTIPGEGTMLSTRYLSTLNDKQAADLLDTIIHEGVHFSLELRDARQDDNNGTGYPYDEARRRTTKDLIERFDKERKQKNSDRDSSKAEKDSEKYIK